MKIVVDEYNCELFENGSLRVSFSDAEGNHVHNFGSAGLPVEKLTSTLLWAATSDRDHYESESLTEVAERQLHYYFWEVAEFYNHDYISEKDWDINDLIEYCNEQKELRSLVEAMLTLYSDHKEGTKKRLADALAQSRIKFGISQIERGYELLKAVNTGNLTLGERLEHRRNLQEAESAYKALQEAQKQILGGEMA